MTDSLEMQIGELLRKHRLKLATAESCTGGLIASRITDVPGSSDYFVGGVAAYAYEAKVGLLRVSWDTLQTYGAVSRETVLEMARGAREILQADIAISVSGIAGPGGGLPDKPVGQRGWLCQLAKANGHASIVLTVIVCKINHRLLMQRCNYCSIISTARAIWISTFGSERETACYYFC